MTAEEKRNRLIALEWEQFQKVQNAGGRADCQDEPETFYQMRHAQYCAWPEYLLDSFARDLEEAAAEGRNLIAEKYAWMMKSTAPAEFEAVRGMLKEPDAEACALIDEIMAVYKVWTREYVRRYPAIASGGRPEESSSDSLGTSIETYQLGELYTYSNRTLRLFRDFTKALKAGGRNLAVMIVEDSMKGYGFRDIDDAERTISETERTQSRG